MAQIQTFSQERLEEILNKATDLTDNRATYITNVRFRISSSDVTLDFYYVAPDPRNPSGDPVAVRTHRVILPLALAKNVGDLLANSVAEWEESVGISLPILPQELVQKKEGNQDETGNI